MIFRIIVGALFVVHGYPKLKNWKQTTTWFQSIGFKPGWLWATVAGLLEFFGGLGLIFAIGFPYIPLLFAGQFLVILVWKIWRKQPFSGQYGWELDFVLFGAVLVLATFGAGAIGGF
jgi:putative oxidoreductase